MMKKVPLLLLAALLVLTPLQSFASDETFGHIGLSEEPLDLEAMMQATLEDEYLARAEYDLILAHYGDLRPFSQIVKAEENHIAALLRLYSSLGLTPPEDRSADFVHLPDSLEEALATGAEAEIANIALYERFLEDETLPPTAERVFTALMRASENHLAAFERGVTGSPRGQGPRRQGR